MIDHKENKQTITIDFSSLDNEYDYIKSILAASSKTLIDLNKHSSKFTAEEKIFLTEFIEILKEEKSKEKEKEREKEREEKNCTNTTLNRNIDKKLLKNHTKNTTKKNKLGLIVDYEIIHPNLLSKPFILNQDMVELYFYTIDIVKKTKYKKNNEELLSEEKIKKNNKSYGMLLPNNLGDYFNFNILRPVKITQGEFAVENVNISYLKPMKLRLSQFNKLVCFHYKFFTDLFGYPQNNFEAPTQERFLGSNNSHPASSERKYLITPIIRAQDNQWIIDEKKLDKTLNLQKNIRIGKTIKEIVNEELNKVGNYLGGISIEQAKTNIKSILQEKIFYSEYKFNLFYIGDIIYSSDNSNTFFLKVAQFLNERLNEIDVSEKSIEEIIAILKTKYFPLVQNYNCLNNKALLVHTQTTSESINSFRKLSDRLNIDIDYDAVGYAYGTPLKPMNNFDFTYNSCFNLKHSNHSQKKLKKKYDNDASIYSIFPVEYMRTYMISKKQYRLATKIPSILTRFERCILAHQMSKKYEINFDYKYSELKYFLWATTAPSMIEEYNYESLETLGDSCIKFLCSYALYLSLYNRPEGALVSERANLLKNDKLHEKGKNSEIYKFIANIPFEVMKWEPPLIRDVTVRFSQSITKKGMADAVEAIIGACFLSNQGLEGALKLMNTLGISPVVEQSISNIYYNIIDNVIVEKIKTLDKSILLEKELLNEFNIKQDVTLIDLHNAYNTNKKELKDYAADFERNRLLQVNKETGKTSLNYQALDKLQKFVLNYQFTNKDLLITAFTHKSFNREINVNYERLEYLGDAILELYIMSNIFNLYEDNIITTPDFNCGNLSKSKAFLASNNFLLKLCIINGLHEYIMIQDYNIRQSIENYLKNLNLDQKMNEYVHETVQRPKVLSDVFEALIGAIFIDSNLEECFRFLNGIYKPYIIYIAKYINEIKFSPVSEFVELCFQKYQIAPKFSSFMIENNYIVEASIGDRLIAQGEASTEERSKDLAAINGIKEILKDEDKKEEI